MGLRHLVTASGLGCVAAVLAGCGSSSAGLLTTAQAGALKDRLAVIDSDVANGQCRKARTAVQSFDAAVKQLPGSVNATLVANLGRGANKLQALTQNCGAGNVTTPTSTSTTTSATSTTPTVASSTTAGNSGDSGSSGSTGSSTGNTGNTGNSGNSGDSGSGSSGSSGTGGTGNSGGSSTGSTGSGDTGSGNTGGTGSGGAGIGQDQNGNGQ